MSEVDAIAAGATAFSAAKLTLELQTRLLRQSLDLQKKAMEEILKQLGLGTKLDVEA